MFATCLTCGTYADAEAHHVAGRHNHATLTVLVCIDCHRTLSNWQLASGIQLREDADRTDTDATRALLVGSIHLLQLYGQRHADTTWLPSAMATLTARAVSQVFDFLQEPHRDGRWVPDASVPLAEARPVAWNTDTEAERTSDMAYLLLELSKIFADIPVLTLQRLREIATHPQDAVNAFVSIAEDPAATEQLTTLLSAYVERANNVTRALLALQPGELPDTDLIQQGSACLAAGHQLLQAAFALADQARTTDQEA